MLTKKLLSITLFIAFSGLLQAQDFDNYKVLENKGSIPTAFTTSSTIKYKEELVTLKKEQKAREIKGQKQFYLETNFVIDDLLLSGKVLFGTELNSYVEKVAAKLLVHLPELKDKVKFYVNRSAAVNAFATNQGIIFVNMGILAQLENEAQLAFILAHELIHVRNKHSLNAFLEKKNIDKSISQGKLMRHTNFDEALIAKNRYSKELETEADAEGLNLYLKTGYSLAALKGSFDVLRYAHLPYERAAFDRSVFDLGNFILPSTAYLEQVKEAKALKDEDDIRSTHPSTQKRLDKILAAIEGKDNEGKQLFVVSQEEFLKTKKIAQFEVVYYYLHAFRYEEAIYTASALLKEYPNNPYLEKSILKALHGACKYMNAMAKDQNNSDFELRESSYKNVEGELQQVYYLLENLKNKELTILALRYAWKLKALFPADNEVEVLLKDLFSELAFHYKDLADFKVLDNETFMKELTDFEAKRKENLLARDLVIQKIKVINPKEDSTATKTTTWGTEFDAGKIAPILTSNPELDVYRIQRDSLQKEATKTFNLLPYALSDILENSSFKEGYELGLKEQDRIAKRTEYYKSAEGQEYLKTEAKRKKKKGAQLGIDSILVLNPYYLKLDTRKDNAYRYIDSELGQENLNKLIAKNAKLLNLHCVLLDANALETDDVEVFNEINTLTDWLSQQTRIGEWTVPGFDQAKIDAIADKYGTPYVLKTGVVMLQKKKSPQMIIAGVWCFTTVFAAPLGVMLLAKQEYELLYFAVLFDVRNQRYQVLRYNVFKRKDKDSFLNAYLYESLYQIKKKDK